MHTGSRRLGAADRSRLERAVVLTLLGDEPERAWSRGALAVELGADGGKLDEVLARLEHVGVVCLIDEAVSAGCAVRRLDALGLISV